MGTARVVGAARWHVVLRPVDEHTPIGRVLNHNNRRRPHSNLDGMTPDRAYFGPQSILPARSILTPAEGALIKAQKLSEQAGPPQPIFAGPES